ncbi:unnamed protein product [Paramecium pentaurelia]|uniref:Uncharacterized protein n=1 Tax=Paramecium pentaurelia TaxID=43138 RepID=A0A8S1VUZ3_9CILI|nr:unnamed protein product [Paramecium pentaurelia]
MYNGLKIYGQFEINLKNEKEQKEKELEQAKKYQRKMFQPPRMTNLDNGQRSISKFHYIFQIKKIYREQEINGSELER